MKNKFLGVIIVLAVAAVAAWNVNFNSQRGDLSDTALENLEALADCESSVTTGRGQYVPLTCTNSNGEIYVISACDYNEGYTGYCSGRPANT